MQIFGLLSGLMRTQFCVKYNKQQYAKFKNNFINVRQCIFLLNLVQKNIEETKSSPERKKIALTLTNYSFRQGFGPGSAVRTGTSRSGPTDQQFLEIFMIFP